MNAEVKGCSLCRLRSRLRRLVGGVLKWRPRPLKFRVDATLPFTRGRDLRAAVQADFFLGSTLCEAKYLVASGEASDDETVKPVSPKQEDGA